MKRSRLLSLLVLSVLGYSLADAAVSQATADSIQNILNHRAGQVCDQSCSLYAQEHNGAGLTNTLFISALLVLGTIWLYLTYKKRYIIVLGTVLVVAVAGTYFAQPYFRSKTPPSNCPELQVKPRAVVDTGFAPVSGGEFEKSDEFSSVDGGEFQSADSVQTAVAGFGNTDEPEKPDYRQVYEPIVVFMILGLIGFLIRYGWFRQTRALFLLGGLVYLGFYNGGCPCFISSFQNTALVLFGVVVKWESLVWFLMLIPAAYLFGRVWCGWLCHFGALQEYLFSSPKLKIWSSGKAQQVIKLVQISVFVLWILQLLVTKTNLWCEYDPFKAAFNLMAANVTGYVLLALLLLSSVLIYRPFCRALCPVGLVLGAISKIPGARRLSKSEACVNCKSCNNNCNQKAMIHEDKKTVLRHEDCILCGECMKSCHKDALSVDWKKLKGKGGATLMILMLLFATSAHAQWECPSRLGGSLKPIGASNLMWAGELTTGAGYVGNYGVGNAMGFVGLDYSKNKYTFYLEGGAKSWLRLDEVNYNNQSSFGMREAFYRYTGDKNRVTIGLQSMRGQDHFLLNERVAGVNYQGAFGSWTLNALGGSVMNHFARNGTFCTLGYLYNIVPGRERALIGRSFGQTNLAMLTLSYKPSQKKENVDEFGTGDILSGEVKPSLFSVKNAGAVAYTEFGSWTENSPLLAGLFAELSLSGVTVKPEILLQSATNNQALLYSVSADKQWSWNNGQITRLYSRYLGYNAIDRGAVPVNSFSNVFAGEVLRLDAIEMPFLQMGLKHSFPRLKASVKLQYAMQTGVVNGYLTDPFGGEINPCRMQELDFTLSKNLGKYVLINASVGSLTYPTMPYTVVYEKTRSLWAKAEMRITF